MTLYYSASMKTFYDSSIHSAVPGDAVEMSRSEHSALLAAQSSGLMISFTDGKPAAVARPAPSKKVRQELKNRQLREKLKDIDATSIRALREFVLTGSKTKLAELETSAEKLRTQIQE